MNGGYQHRRIHHSSRVYVVADIHTNSVEGFWSLIKRRIGGVYQSVGQKYLQSYLDGHSYCYNRSDYGNLIFNSVLGEVWKRAGAEKKPPDSEGHQTDLPLSDVPF